MSPYGLKHQELPRLPKESNPVEVVFLKSCNREERDFPRLRRYHKSESSLLVLVERRLQARTRQVGPQLPAMEPKRLGLIKSSMGDQVGAPIFLRTALRVVRPHPTIGTLVSPTADRAQTSDVALRPTITTSETRAGLMKAARLVATPTLRITGPGYRTGGEERTKQGPIRRTSIRRQESKTRLTITTTSSLTTRRRTLSLLETRLGPVVPALALGATREGMATTDTKIQTSLPQSQSTMRTVIELPTAI